MDAFKYTKLATESGRDGLIALGICALVIALVVFKLSSRPDGLFSKSNMLIIAGLIVFSAIAINSVVSRLQSSGAWEISISQGQLKWEGPAGLDRSFTTKLTDIQSFRIASADNENFTEYTLVLNTGQEMMLSEESGLDFDEFATALEGEGVLVEHIETRASQ